MREKFLELFVCALIVAVLIAASLLSQPEISVASGLGYDGVEYAKVYNYFSGYKSDAAEYPFCQRIGLPFLAAHTNAALIFAFKFWNLIFSFLFSFVIYLIARARGYSIRWSALAVSLSLIPFFAPARFVPFYPVYVDPPFLFFLSLSVFFAVSGRCALSFFMVVFSSLFREAALFVLPMILSYSIAAGGLLRPVIRNFFIAIFAVLAMNIFIRYNFDCSGSQFRTAISWIGKGLDDPVRFVNCFASFLMVAAPIFFVERYEDLDNFDRSALLCALLAAALAFVGGSDATRIFYGFFPVYFLLIVSVMRSKGRFFALLTMIGYVVSNRFGQKILESPSEFGDVFWQTPDHARVEAGLAVIAVWIIVYVIYYWFLRLGFFRDNLA